MHAWHAFANTVLTLTRSLKKKTKKGTEGKLALQVESHSRVSRLNTPLGAVTILTVDDQPGGGSHP